MIRDDDEVDAGLEALMSAMERAIEQEMSGAEMSPYERLCLDGMFREVRPVRVDGKAALMAAATPPLEFLHFQAKSRIPAWQYLAGVRFRADWTVARVPSSGVVDPTRLAMFNVDGLSQQRAAYTGKGHGGGISRIDNVPAARLDAQRRLGKLASRIPALSFRLAEMIIGLELRMGEVGVQLGMDERSVGHRFREALIHLAGAYALSHTTDARPRATRVMHFDAEQAS